MGDKYKVQYVHYTGQLKIIKFKTLDDIANHFKCCGPTVINIIKYGRVKSQPNIIKIEKIKEITRMN